MFFMGQCAHLGLQLHPVLVHETRNIEFTTKLVYTPGSQVNTHVNKFNLFYLEQEIHLIYM